MTCRLLNLLTALSLFLWVTACVLWVRSYWAADAVTVFNKGPSGTSGT